MTLELSDYHSTRHLSGVGTDSRGAGTEGGTRLEPDSDRDAVRPVPLCTSPTPTCTGCRLGWTRQTLHLRLEYVDTVLVVFRGGPLQDLGLDHYQWVRMCV